MIFLTKKHFIKTLRVHNLYVSIQSNMEFVINRSLEIIGHVAHFVIAIHSTIPKSRPFFIAQGISHSSTQTASLYQNEDV